MGLSCCKWIQTYTRQSRNSSISALVERRFSVIQFQSLIRLLACSEYFTKEGFKEHCLGIHNYYRDELNMEPLKLSPELSSFAQEWADLMASKEMMMHRPNNNYGENVWMFLTTDCPDEEDLAYADMVSDQVLGSGEDPATTLNGSSEYLGVGIAKTREYAFVVCNYDPSDKSTHNYDLTPLVIDKQNVQNYWTAIFPRHESDDFQTFSQLSSNVFNWSTVTSQSTVVEFQCSIRRLPWSKITKEEITKQCLEIHNICRAKLNMEPLKLSPELSSYAQEWAEFLTRKNKIMNRGNKSYGENVWMLEDYTPKKYLEYKNKLWANFLKNGEDPTYTLNESGEYLGVGIAKTRKCAFLVCNYYPPTHNYDVASPFDYVQMGGTSTFLRGECNHGSDDDD